MTEKYHVLWPDSRITLEEIPRDQMLDRMYEIIGCDCVEQVRTWLNGVCLIVDESGRIKDPPQQHNNPASFLYFGWIFGNDDIVGPAILVSLQRTGPLDELDWFPLTDEQSKTLHAFFGDDVTWEGC